MTMTEPGRPVDDATELAHGCLMLAFDGVELPAPIAERLLAGPAAGVTLFRHQNVRTPAQVRALTDAIQASARRRPSAGPAPLLVAADQEGGQLIALGDGSTPFAGNLALAAAGDSASGLAERVGRAIGREARAMGVNVVYAPNCDLATNPTAPSVGIRSFGDDPVAAGELAAATIRGLESAGVAATMKHFPGGGDPVADPHHGRTVVEGDRARLDAVELLPFRAAIVAGARLAMAGHLAVPAITGDRTTPATLSPAILRRLLRDELGFGGVTVSDALDMGGFAAAERRAAAVVDAVKAGVDLLLCAPDEDARRRIESALRDAVARGELGPGDLTAGARRVAALRAWLGEPARGAMPDVDVVGCPDHLALARELAERSITLVRDDDGALPLDPSTAGSVLAVMPQPVDQTPADTSSTVPPGLAPALRHAGYRVDEVVVGHEPSDAEISGAVARAREASVVVVGTTAAHAVPAQAAIVRAVLAAGPRVVTVALRTPFDLAAYPASRTHLSTYGLLPPSMAALAGALAGRIPLLGRLPAAIPGLHPTGFGIVRHRP